jgi:hypothetical protein
MSDAAATYGWDTTQYVQCGWDGPGMFLQGWEGTVTYSYEDIPLAGSIVTELSPPRMYLPAEADIGSSGSWSYSYTDSMLIDAGTGSTTPLTQNITGTYTESGFEEYTLYDGTVVEAYKLVNEYSSSDGTTTVTGTIEQWWVKGLGLVKESHIRDGSELSAKELTAHTGLSVIE